MVYRGQVRNGRIELDEAVGLPDGATVTVEVEDNGSQGGLRGDVLEPLGKKLMRHAGTAEGLPPDAARNLDHYLYGLPKR
jgi:hypothetical protein